MWDINCLPPYSKHNYRVAAFLLFLEYAKLCDQSRCLPVSFLQRASFVPRSLWASSFLSFKAQLSSHLSMEHPTILCRASLPLPLLFSCFIVLVSLTHWEPWEPVPLRYSGPSASSVDCFSDQKPASLKAPIKPGVMEMMCKSGERLHTCFCVDRPTAGPFTFWPAITYLGGDRICDYKGLIVLFKFWFLRLEWRIHKKMSFTFVSHVFKTAP